MHHRFKFPGFQGRILIVTGPSFKSVAIKIVSNLGHKVDAVTGLKAALERLEADPFDWVIMILNNQPYKTDHITLLKLCCKHQELRHLKVSIVYAKGTDTYLPESYHYGLLSHSQAQLSSKGLNDTFKKLQARIATYKKIAPLIAASFLREILLEQRKYNDIKTLNQSLLKALPHMPELYLELAKSQFLLDQTQAATNSALQAKFLAEDLEEDVGDLFREYGIDNPTSSGKKLNILGIKKCVLIDHDDTVTYDLKNLMNDIGVPQTDIFNNGLEAFEAISKAQTKPELVILEWKLSGLTGPVLIQRLRSGPLPEATIIMLSSLVSKKDLPILREMTVSQLFEKPLIKQKFTETIISAIQESKTPTTVTNLEANIKKLLLSNNLTAAEDELKAFETKFGSLPNHWRTKAIHAQLGYRKGKFHQTINLCFEAIQTGGDTIDLMNLIGKTFMQIGYFENALKCFERAQKNSSLNIERLCKIAECHNELGNKEAADQSLEKAKEIDPKNLGIQETAANIEITHGEPNKARAILASLDNIDNIISLMNNRAIAFSRSGNIEASIELYRRTIKSIPEHLSIWKPLVLYNLSLAYVRNSEIEEGLIPLQRVLKHKNSSVYKKAKNLANRIITAIEDGTPFELNIKVTNAGNQQLQINQEKPKSDTDTTRDSKEQNIAKASTVEKSAPQTTLIEVLPGSMALYIIYNAPLPVPQPVAKTLVSLPKFQPRDAIKRPETMGSDRVAKRAS